MAGIAVLDQGTIDKIAAGEVIERPASVVKELLENAIDAGATAVTVEIKEGGSSFIRVTDNGCGIPKEEIALAFLRHSTSKIHGVEDLFTISSLGFRGEALSSIAAVSQVELITRTSKGMTGSRYQIEGGKEKSLEEIGAPEGTTFIVRNLFYNTPARRKFLKTPMTEAAHAADLVEKIALSHPEISIRFIQNNQNKLHTSGNHNLKDLIYTIFGREITSNLLPVRAQGDCLSVEGFIGKPVIARGNRNYENYFINGRYIRSSLIAKAIEEAYKPYMMQHKYPFTLLHFRIEPEFLDVNVHPTKMELKFQNGELVFKTVLEAVKGALAGRELIPQVELEKEKESGEGRRPSGKMQERFAEPFEKNRLQALREGKRRTGETAGPERLYEEPGGKVNSGFSFPEFLKEAGLEWETESRERAGAGERATAEKKAGARPGPEERAAAGETAAKPCPGERAAGRKDAVKSSPGGGTDGGETAAKPWHGKGTAVGETAAEPPQQMELFDGRLLEPEARSRHKLIGQLFDTYWLVEYGDHLYIIDQHAAHEKVLYEKTMASLKSREHTSQAVNPPIILTLGMNEELQLKKHMDYFAKIGFEIEHFGGREYAVRGVPGNLFSIAKKDLLMEMIDGLSGEASLKGADMIYEKVASMSCKAAVKGNHQMSAAEADVLIDQLLELENPYACPHGRPTIISMSKYELEKKFKRIL